MPNNLDILLEVATLPSQTLEDIQAYAPIRGAAGADGTDGKEVTLRVLSQILQWKYTTDSAYINLFDFATLNLPISQITSLQTTLDGKASLSGSYSNPSWITALNVAQGGTGAASFTAGRILFGNGTSALGSSSNLYWDNTNGRLGIGTTSPSDPISIYSTAEGRVRLYNTSGTNKQNRVVFSTGTGAGNIQFQLGTDYNGTNTTDFFIKNESLSNPAIYVKSDNMVGVNTSNPYYNLDVNGTGRFTGALTLSTALTVPNGGTGLTSLTAGYIPFGNGTSAFGSSANLVWSNSTNSLSINSPYRTYSLECYGATTLSRQISTTANVFNAINSTSGNAEYGIYANRLYFQNLTLSGGIGFYGNSSSTAGMVIDASNNVSISNTTASTSTSTGSLITAGGFGAAGNINGGGYIKTAQPSTNGAGAWKLGKLIGADGAGATSFIEVEIEGVLYILTAKIK